MGATSGKNIQIEAWKINSSVVRPSDFPETTEIELRSKPNTAICFSGKGARGMCLGIGILAGIRDIGLGNRLRYIGGVSGGGWAALLYTYSQLSDDDKVFLGPIHPPETLKLETLTEMHSQCIRRVIGGCYDYDSVVNIAIERATAWKDHIVNKMLKPALIEADKLFSWNEATVEDIVRRNSDSGLQPSDFLLPRKRNGPYMLVGWALVGPTRTMLDSFFPSPSREIRFVDVTPLYCGQIRHHVCSFGSKNLLVGGLIEPFGFSINAASPPEKGLGEEETNGFLSMPKSQMLDIANVAATVGYSKDDFLDYHDPFASPLDLSFDYFSPVEPKPSLTSSHFCDAQTVQCNPMVPFIQRDVERIVYVSSFLGDINFSLLLDCADSDNWKVTKTVPRESFDSLVASFFGIGHTVRDVDGLVRTVAESLNNQIFESKEFEDLLVGLKAAAQRRSGACHRQKFTTVSNTFGILPGRKVDVLFVFAGNCNTWKSKLTPWVRSRVFDRSIVESNCFVASEPQEFEGFPQYLRKKSLTQTEVNLLCNYIGWIVIENQDLFIKFLS